MQASELAGGGLSNCVAVPEKDPLLASRGRVLLVTSSFPRWEGDSTTPFILHLARDLRALGWQVHVLAPHAEGAARWEQVDGVTVERFRYIWPESAQTVCYNGGALINLRNNRLNFFKLPALVGAQIAAVARRLGNKQFDLVHSHWILPQGFTVGLVARTMNVPHVVTVHGGDAFALNGPLLTRVKRFAFGLADVITVNSSATRQAITQIGHGEVPVFTIPMGASPSAANADSISAVRSRYRRGNGPLVIFVGRLIDEKGVSDLLEAVAKLRSTHPDVTALVVGEGPERAAFEQHTLRLGLGDVVQFTGWMPTAEVGWFLRASDVFVAPSKRSANGWVEAQGLTIVEAMLAGVPVVATATGGISDLVRDRETGFLVPESSPVDIAAAVRRVIGDPALRQHVIAKAQLLAERDYTRINSARRFSDLFEDLIRRRRNRNKNGSW